MIILWFCGGLLHFYCLVQCYIVKEEGSIDSLITLHFFLHPIILFLIDMAIITISFNNRIKITPEIKLTLFGSSLLISIVAPLMGQGIISILNFALNFDVTFQFEISIPSVKGRISLTEGKNILWSLLFPCISDYCNVNSNKVDYNAVFFQKHQKVLYFSIFLYIFSIQLEVIFSIFFPNP